MSIKELFNEGTAKPWANLRVNQIYFADSENGPLSSYEEWGSAGNTWSGPSSNPIASEYAIVSVTEPQKALH